MVIENKADLIMKNLTKRTLAKFDNFQQYSKARSSKSQYKPYEDKHEHKDFLNLTERFAKHT